MPGAWQRLRYVRWPLLRHQTALLLVIATMVFPLLWMIAAALKTQHEIIDPNSSLLPLHPQWSNIRVAWNTAPFGTFFLNTAISLVTTVGQIATGMMAGYAFAMFDFPAKRSCSTWS